MEMMRLWLAMSRLLTVLAVVGLVAGAFAAPAKAVPMGGMPATSISVDGMPCCDPAQSAANDCRTMKACPFAAICAAKCPQGLVKADFDHTRLSVETLIPLRNDRQGKSLAAAPLGHPPKA